VIGTSISDAVAVEIGGLPIRLRARDQGFLEMLRTRYRGFVNPAADPAYEFEIEIVAPQESAESDEDLRVRCNEKTWELTRGDFRATWDAARRCGCVRQSANPYSIDSVLRVVHTLALAREGGFLLHAASGIRNGKAFAFSGVSGAGKTTISRLAPSDVRLLTDEISYIRRVELGYIACGTPFAGELARAGENLQSPLQALFFLRKGLENRIDPVAKADALRELMRNILFFAEDPELVNMVFASACEFVERVPVGQLTFVPNERVWGLIG
jgi:hypothetical protein